ncbi:MAG: hypothetical protein LBD16_08005 [Oscillospiraceae bacterium]|jgi:hypothetical protein|nr:hypothetical protein [Oscillospiraceae bacterium]
MDKNKRKNKGGKSVKNTFALICTAEEDGSTTITHVVMSDEDDVHSVADYILNMAGKSKSESVKIPPLFNCPIHTFSLPPSAQTKNGGLHPSTAEKEPNRGLLYKPSRKNHDLRVIGSANSTLQARAVLARREGDSRYRVLRSRDQNR